LLCPYYVVYLPENSCNPGILQMQASGNSKLQTVDSGCKAAWWNSTWSIQVDKNDGSRQPVLLGLRSGELPRRKTDVALPIHREQPLLSS
jgi:hypothetical protein